ncbi:VTT domain-containing protein [Ferroacidibacillus organovorans]|nr:VTT domain-containing protein [Ferroacidibacillus organovorans]
MTPVPSEGLLVMYFKVFGVVYGGLYSWSGAMLGSVFTFMLARYFISPILRTRLPVDRFERIERWIAKRGAVGLLFVRLLPVPAFVQSL